MRRWAAARSDDPTGPRDERPAPHPRPLRRPRRARGGPVRGQAGHRRPGRDARAPARRAARRRPRAARGRPRPGQDPDRQDAGRGASAAASAASSSPPTSSRPTSSAPASTARTRGRFDIELGPVFGNFLLADEINRAPAKVQSRAAGGHAGAPGHDRRRQTLPRCPSRSSSWRPRTRSSPRAPTRCPRRRSTASCSSWSSATRPRARRPRSSGARSAPTSLVRERLVARRARPTTARRSRRCSSTAR